nr:xylulose kinase-1 [Tanacetum cinerariifolium]
SSSNLRNHATIQDGGVTVQQVQGRKGKSYSGTGYKSNATRFGGNNASGHERVIKCYNYQDPEVLDGQAVQSIIPNNVAFQTEDRVLMILTVIISQIQKWFSWPTFPTMVLTLSQRKLKEKEIVDIAAQTPYAYTIVPDEAGNEVEVPPVTAQQILARTKERKAKSTLLMAILDKHLARFHGIKYAKTLWDAIKTRFGGNVESKKMQKMY